MRKSLTIIRGKNMPILKIDGIYKKFGETEVLKGIEFKVTDFCPIEQAIITSGGVNVKEINPSTMESKLVKGLYFCGEVIDVDGYTGGYNLQIAFSTGYLAGKSCLN